jgi:hypothetical protein
MINNNIPTIHPMILPTISMDSHMPFINPFFATPRTLKTNATENIKIRELITTNVWQTF